MNCKLLRSVATVHLIQRPLQVYKVVHGSLIQLICNASESYPDNYFHCRCPMLIQIHSCQTDLNILDSSAQFQVTVILIQQEYLFYIISTGQEWEPYSRMHPVVPQDMHM